MQRDRDAGLQTSQKVNVAPDAFQVVAANIQTQRLVRNTRSNIVDPQDPYDDPFKKEDKKPPPVCPCDTKIFKISYEDMQSTVKRDNPTYTDHEVRVKTAKLFRPKYHSDRKARVQETSGEKKYTSIATFTMDDEEKLVYTNVGYKGVSIEDFSLRQLKLTPERYSLKDHQTSIAIQQRFQAGATRVVTSYLREGNDNRDILVMEYNPATKEGTIHVINTEADGQCHDSETITEIAKELYPTYDEFNSHDGVFVLSDTAMKQEDVQIAITRVEELAQERLTQYSKKENRETPIMVIDQDSKLLEQPYANPLQREAIDIIQRVSQDATQTVKDVVRYVKEKQQQKVDEKEYINQQKANSERLISAFRPVIPIGVKMEIMKRIKNIPIGKQIHFEETINQWHQAILQSFDLPEVSIEQLIDVVVAAEYVRQQKAALTVALETGVATGAIPLIIQELALIQPKESNMMQPMTVDALLQLLGVDSKTASFETHDELSLTAEQKIGEATLLTDLIVDEWASEFVEQLNAKTPEEVVVVIEQEKKQVETKIQQLWEVATELVEPAKLEEQQIMQFSFAVTLWLLFNYINYARRIDAVKRSMVEIGKTLVADHKRIDVVSLKRSIKENMSEKLVEKEPAPWLLFAIVWILAMRRESCVAGSGSAGQVVSDSHKNIQKKTKQSPTPMKKIYPFERQAVIFAFAS